MVRFVVVNDSEAFGAGDKALDVFEGSLVDSSDVPAPAQSQKPGQAGPKKAGPSRAMVAGLSRLLARPTICAGQSRRPGPRLSRDLVYPTNGERRGHRPLSYPPPQFTGTPTISWNGAGLHTGSSTACLAGWAVRADM